MLTDDGQLVLGYAEEIFQLGQELLNAVKSRPSSRALRLYVGVTDSFPKLLTNDILQPVFTMSQPVHIVCREGKMEDLLAQLAAHRRRCPALTARNSSSNGPQPEADSGAG